MPNCSFDALVEVTVGLLMLIAHNDSCCMVFFIVILLKSLARYRYAWARPQHVRGLECSKESQMTVGRNTKVTL